MRLIFTCLEVLFLPQVAHVLASLSFLFSRQLCYAFYHPNQVMRPVGIGDFLMANQLQMSVKRISNCGAENDPPVPTLI